MKYYGKLLELGCFSKKDLIKITGNSPLADWVAAKYLKDGLIERVKKDLYVAISLESRQPVLNRYAIATRICEDAIVSYHSAFEFHGIANQVFYEVQVTSKTRFRDFEYGDIYYRRMNPCVQGGVMEMNGVRVTTLERTVIDCIHLYEKVGGLEELLRCLALIPSLDERKLEEILEEYQNGYLYQKAGYILSFFSKELGLSQSFFSFCRSHLPQAKPYLIKKGLKLVWNKEWRLYAPFDLMEIVNKGVADYDAMG
ncbi:MAG: type IV toxin-antitoxin system AbiEi family antitoxin [Candidatus Enteromonas sp.]